MDFFNPFSSVLMFGFALLSIPMISALYISNSRMHTGFLIAWIGNTFLLCIPNILGFAGFFATYYEWRYLPVTVFTLSGPLLIGYFLTLTKEHIDKKCWLIFIVPFIEFIYRLVLFVPSMQTKKDWLENWHQPVFDNLITALGCCLMVYAVWVVHQESKAFRIYLAETSSNVQDFSNFVIMIAVSSILLVSVSWLLIDMYEFMGGILSHKQEFPLYLLLIFNAFVLCHISMYSSFASFNRIDKPTELIRARKGDKTAQSSQLLDELKKKKLHLHSRLNIATASELLNCRTEQLASNIKQSGFNNFNHFINSLRIEEAKDKLTQTDMGILDIAFQSGFNSKASFNRAFKDLVDLTPTQYREVKKIDIETA